MILLAIFSFGAIANYMVKNSEMYKRLIVDKPLGKKVTNVGRVEKIGQGEDEIRVLYVKGTRY